MNKVTVLVEGYAHENSDGTYTASPTTTLVESNGVKFIVDPGAGPKLEKALKKNKLSQKDISFVYLTHYHPDHLLNIRLFPYKDIYDGEICWKEDKEIFHKGKLPGVTGIKVIKTPGHAPESTSLVIKTREGVVCICADVFWWEDGKQNTDNIEDLLNLLDPFVSDEKALAASRKLVLSKADFIIPGHGKIFKTPKTT